MGERLCSNCEQENGAALHQRTSLGIACLHLVTMCPTIIHGMRLLSNWSEMFILCIFSCRLSDFHNSSLPPNDTIEPSVVPLSGEQTRQDRRVAESIRIQLCQWQPKRLQHRRSDLSITHNLRDIRRLQIGIVCNQWHVEILGQEPSMVLKLEAGVPQGADLGSDDKIRNSRVEVWGSVAGCCDLIASEHVRNAQGGIGEEFALGFLGI